MTNTNIFEVAVRYKFRFPFKGLISVEDLWDLNLENLDSVFKTLNSQLKTVQEESLLNTKTKENKELDVKIEIVKYIVDVKLTEQENRSKEKEQKEKKQRIMEVLRNKQDEALLNMSPEQLEKMLQELE
ncbi:hypothetical protein EBB07_29000 [Paenibacillaceae bacterium]|nr:hypothetical protein EBB07_29000 [Paenibacillaceae bacterium]